ncbi:hypothetical protein O6H91_13G070800 [Diphasiastrum complanatum]|uniref:Uncharacterized protein n=1 Tax=Diphasiastrum complanatum TaxID=34168 RepID=A0ACC2BW28_DIPCM|nr:hypothetical protein O6H91_13G070800 [Diphasiastrum complanatum]
MYVMNISHTLITFVLCVILVFFILPSFCMRSLPPNIERHQLLIAKQAEIAGLQFSQHSVVNSADQNPQHTSFGNKLLISRRLPAVPTPPSEPNPGGHASGH